MRRSLGGFLVGAAVLVPGAVVMAPAVAATTYVVGTASSTCPSPDYSTIHDAVAAASDGDTITVCAGSYTEGIDDQGKNLTFLGAQAGVSGPGRGGSASESWIQEPGSKPVVLTGTSTVDGFRITALSGGLGVGASLASGDTVENSRIDDVNVGAEFTGANNTLANNDIDISSNNNGFSTIGVDLPSGGGASSTIEGNAFHGALQDGAVSINQDASPAPVSGVTISGNTATMDDGNFVQAVDASSLSITGNTVTETSPTFRAAVDLRGDSDTFSIRGNTFTGSNSVIATYTTNAASGDITGNTFAHNYNGLVQHSPGSIALTSNVFIDEQITGISTYDPGSVVAHSNVFTGNAIGVDNHGTSTVDATDNFWGCNTGPNTPGCDTTSGTVNTSPYLVLSSSIGSHSVPIGQTTTFTADLNHDNHGATVADPVPDGLVVHFSYDKGNVTPADSLITNGRRSTTVHPSSTGSGTVSATVLNATTSQPLTSTPYRPRISIHDAGTAEGNSGTHPLNFTVTLNHATTVATNLKFTTANGSATAPSDFVAKTGTLTIPAGHTSGTITVTIKGDRLKEPSETMVVNIYAPSIGSIADPVGVGTIRNDD